MRNYGHRAGHGRAAVALFVVVLQLVAATWAAIAHAASFEAPAGPAVEATHSADCPAIHVETWCTVCAASPDLRPAEQRSALDPVDILSTHCSASTEGRVPTAPSSPATPSRAPPNR